MNKKLGVLLLGSTLIFGMGSFSWNINRVSAISQVSSKTLVLYDAASGAVPSTQLMNFIDFPLGIAAPTYENAATILDTAKSGSETYAGWASTAEAITGFPILDPATGFQANLSLQLESESHSNHHRAGFNLIILGNDARGIELAFWANEIWAQNDNQTGGLFTHGEGITISTTSFTNYQITISSDTYTLVANGTPILSGPVRDYTSFEGFPDPYQTPNFLFIGDNTTSAQARIRLGHVSVTGTEVAPIEPTITPTLIASASPTSSPTATGPHTPTPTPVSGGWEFCAFLPSALAFSVMWIKSDRTKRDWQ